MSYSPFPPAFTTPGAGNPTDLIVVGGSDGTDARSLLTDSSGRVLIQQPDQVLQATVAVTPAATAVTKTNTATVNGLGVAVTIANSDTSPYTANVSVKVVNATTGVHSHWQSCGLLWNGSDATLFFNLPIAISDSIVVSITSPSTQTASKTNLTAIVTALPMAVSLRSDGRGMPLSSQFVENQFSTSGGTLISAPASGFRLLISSALIIPGSGSIVPTTFVSGTVNGSAVNLIAGVSPANSIGPPVTLPAPGGGVLLDPATSLQVPAFSLTSPTLFPYAFASYDVVPT